MGNYPLCYFLYATLAQQTTGSSYFMDAGFVTASPSPEPTSETDERLPDGAIAGIVIAVAVIVSVVIVVVLSVAFFVNRSKQKMRKLKLAENDKLNDFPS